VKKVLWISRHRPLPAQLSALSDKLGPFELIRHSEPLSTANDAVKIIKEHNANYVVPVLPLSFITLLVQATKRENFVVLRAEMENLHNCVEHPCPDYNPETDTIMQSKDFTSGETIHRHFRFREFVVLKDIQIITEPF